MQAFVRLHLIGLRLPYNKFDSLTDHRFSGQLRPRTQRDRDIGAESKPKIIRLTLYYGVEDGLWRALEFNEYFGHRDGHRFHRNAMRTGFGSTSQRLISRITGNLGIESAFGCTSESTQ